MRRSLSATSELGFRSAWRTTGTAATRRSASERPTAQQGLACTAFANDSRRSVEALSSLRPRTRALARRFGFCCLRFRPQAQLSSRGLSALKRPVPARCGPRGAQVRLAYLLSTTAEGLLPGDARLAPPRRQFGTRRQFDAELWPGLLEEPRAGPRVGSTHDPQRQSHCPPLLLCADEGRGDPNLRCKGRSSQGPSEGSR